VVVGWFLASGLVCAAALAKTSDKVMFLLANAESGELDVQRGENGEARLMRGHREIERTGSDRLVRRLLAVL